MEVVEAEALAWLLEVQTLVALRLDASGY